MEPDEPMPYRIADDLAEDLGASLVAEVEAYLAKVARFRDFCGDDEPTP